MVKWFAKRSMLVLCVAMLSIGAHAQTVSRQVLAFYYGWYATPSVSGKWLHWKDVDPQHRKIAGSTHYPAGGAYDSHDPQKISWQFDEAREAGITGFICSWWAQGDFQDQGLPTLLKMGKEKGISISIIYEDIKGNTAADKVRSAIADLEYILNQYGSDPAWLKANGRPVIFVYQRALDQLSNENWRRVTNEVRKESKNGASILADTASRDTAEAFDGSFRYTVATATFGKHPKEIRQWAERRFPQLIALPGPGKIRTVTIIPGYDDSKLPERPKPRPTTQRWDGDTYRVLWQEALNLAPDYVLISSWNEWHEGSEIEPSEEQGSRFVQETAPFARQFLQDRR